MDQAEVGIYAGTQLAPVLLPSMVVILDNLATHKSQKSARVLNAPNFGCCSFRPARQIKLPIEMAFPELKTHLRRVGASTCDIFIHAHSTIYGRFNPEACRNSLKAAGYPSV